MHTLHEQDAWLTKFTSGGPPEYEADSNADPNIGGCGSGGGSGSGSSGASGSNRGSAAAGEVSLLTTAEAGELARLQEKVEQLEATRSAHHGQVLLAAVAAAAVASFVMRRFLNSSRL
jgi:hypothetical protein